MVSSKCVLLWAVGAMLAQTSAVGAASVTRSVIVTPDASQIFDAGEFGSGVFWRPEFALAPFEVLGPGDTVEVEVLLAPGWRVRIDSIPAGQESAFGAIGFPDGQRTETRATFEFLDFGGDLLSPTLEIFTLSEGGGIAANFNPINHTDTAFTFGGVRYAFEILDTPQLLGLPAKFDAGFIAIQSAGSIAFLAVSEPSPLALFGLGLASVLASRVSARSTTKGRTHEPALR